MSLRLAQQVEPRNFGVPDFTLLRGATAVAISAGTLNHFTQGYVTFVKGHITATGTIPGSGNWTVDLGDGLDGFDNQYFGRGGVGTSLTDLTYAAGVLSFVVQPTVASGTVIQIQGALS